MGDAKEAIFVSEIERGGVALLGNFREKLKSPFRLLLFLWFALVIRHLKIRTLSGFDGIGGIFELG